MVNLMAIRRVVGIIGNIISFGLFLAPGPTFLRILKKKSVEDFSPMPYLATLLNCAVWVFYGMPFISESNVLVYTINGIGLLLEAIYLTIYFLYAPSKGRKKVLMILALEIAFMVLAVGLICGLLHPMKKRTIAVGVLAVCFGTIMYASPLTVMRMVIKTKSVEYMPFTLSFVCFINGLCWTAYSLLKFDIFMIIPNGSGTVLGAIQLILYGIYYRTTPKAGSAENNKDAKSVQMTETV